MTLEFVAGVLEHCWIIATEAKVASGIAAEDIMAVASVILGAFVVGAIVAMHGAIIARSIVTGGIVGGAIIVIHSVNCVS